MARSTQEVFRQYRHALESGDLPAIMADYAEDAVLVTPSVVVAGADAIRAF